jgi:hypothetical protein
MLRGAAIVASMRTSPDRQRMSEMRHDLAPMMLA